MISLNRMRFAVPLLAALALGACDDDDPVPTNPVAGTIVDVASSNPDLSTLVAALTAADLTATLNGDGPFTVFAPRNAAFTALGADVVAGLLVEGNLAELQRILGVHVVVGAGVLSTDLSDGQTFTSLEGEELTIDITGGVVSVNGSTVSTPDVEASNGIIHIVDNVIVPAELDVYETALLTPSTTTLASAILAGGLKSAAQGPDAITVFAPDNDAFGDLGGYTLGVLLDADNQALLSDVLTYHIVSGTVEAADLVNGPQETLEGGDIEIVVGPPTTVNSATVTATNISASNGVIHLIDGVLLESLDIVERAIITEETETLVTAVVAAGLVDALSSPEGPYTVFAPVNAAFAALPADQLAALLDTANVDLLQKVLTFHVVNGSVLAGSLVDGQRVPTLQGDTLTIDLSDPMMPMVNGANIVATDIVTENGVIHLIDAVMTDNLDIVDVARVNGFTELVGALEATDLDDALRGANNGNGFTVFAPTNAAFEALGGVIPPNLEDILLYHVLSGTVEAGDLSDGDTPGTLYSTHSFTVNIDAGTMAVTITDEAGNTVNVTVFDVMAKNGIIHVVDAILIPVP